MYQALYRTYRPETFDEILGQEHIVKILRNQIITDTVSHAYLFCGTRGTGKTTMARILAKGVNCTSAETRPCGICENCMSIKEGIFMDVIEMDAASNNGVENIRELRESVKYPPAVGRKKVYIIDEVHMLSTGAFNALLKTLEEPPENVMFILATTEVQKLPATILSRCMRLDFKRVPEGILKAGMEVICTDRGISVEQSALRLIASNADGSVRDGLSILDQCLSTGEKEISRDDVLEFLGASGEEVFLDLTAAIIGGHVSDALVLLDRVLSDGKDVRQFMRDWLSHYRGLLITKFIKEPQDILNMSIENVNKIREQSQKLDVSEIDETIVELSRTMAEAKWSTQPRILLELCIVKLAAGIGVASVIPKTTTANVAQKRAIESQAASATTDFKENVPYTLPTSSSMNAEVNANTDAGTKSDAMNMLSVDLAALWHAILEDGEDLQGSFNLIRTGTILDHMTDNEFVVVTPSEIKLNYVNNNAKALEDLMEKHTGKRRLLKCKVMEMNQQANAEKSIEKIAAEAEQKFGINIEIE